MLTKTQAEIWLNRKYVVSKDLQHITTDQENFLIQKNAVGGKKTMTAYLWKVCGDIYDAQH